MARSRRHTRKQGPDRLRRRWRQQEGQTCSCGCAGEMVTVPSSELISYMDRTRTPSDEEMMRASLRAESNGDPARALDLYLQCPHIPGAPHERDLRDLIQLGPDAPSWVIARWIVVQAALWMLMHEDPRTDMAVRLTMAATYPEMFDLDARGIYELGTEIAACDQLYDEMVLYEMSGVADYIDAVVSDRLLARAPFVDSWPQTRLHAYQYGGVADGKIAVVDLATDETVELLHVGCMTGANPGQYVLGRVVPIAAEPGLMFARRPVPVDQTTAYATLQRQDEMLGETRMPGWLCAVGAGVDAGRLARAPGRLDPTPLTSDVVYDPLDQRWTERVEYGAKRG